MAVTDTTNVVDLLTKDHKQIGSLLKKLETARRGAKQRLFEELVRTVMVHETAEEEVLHPEARFDRNIGDDVVDDRLAEEHEIKEDLAELSRLGVDHPAFDNRMMTLADRLTDHMQREETEIFRPLRENLTRERLYRMSAGVRAAKHTAPTRPHTMVGESATAQLLVGTPLGVLDRMRDTVRDLRRQRA